MEAISSWPHPRAYCRPRPWYAGSMENALIRPGNQGEGQVRPPDRELARRPARPARAARGVGADGRKPDYHLPVSRSSAQQPRQ
jgi:hypothetical protein